MLLKSFTNGFKLPQRRLAKTIKGAIKPTNPCSSICKAIRLFNVDGVPFARCIKKCYNNVVLVTIIIVNCNQSKEEFNKGAICYSSVNILGYLALSVLKVSANNLACTVLIPFALGIEFNVENPLP